LRPAGLAPVPHGHTPDARRRPTLSRTQGSRPPCGSTSSRHHVVQPRRSGAAPAGGQVSSQPSCLTPHLLRSPFPAQLGLRRVLIHPRTSAIGPVPCTATCFSDTFGTGRP